MTNLVDVASYPFVNTSLAFSMLNTKRDNEKVLKARDKSL